MALTAGRFTVRYTSRSRRSPLFSCSRSIRSSSLTSVSSRNSSASVCSAVVNGPVGGRCPPGKRSRRARKRLMRRAYCAYVARADGHKARSPPKPTGIDPIVWTYHPSKRGV
jgi:hypothetical protein